MPAVGNTVTMEPIARQASNTFQYDSHRLHHAVKVCSYAAVKAGSKRKMDRAVQRNMLGWEKVSLRHR